MRSKFQAIKAVKDLSIVPTIVPSVDVVGQWILIAHANTVGLKEAKDLVEAIMELGVREYLKEQARAKGVGVLDDVHR